MIVCVNYSIVVVFLIHFGTMGLVMNGSFFLSFNRYLHCSSGFRFLRTLENSYFFNGKISIKSIFIFSNRRIRAM